MEDRAELAGQISRHALDRLLESRRQFLSFIESRVESREVAEDILQAAFVRGLERGGALRDEETVVAWFYRLLRNAIIDHYRQRGSSERAAEALVHELETHAKPVDSFRGDICGCISGLLATLKPEYRDALETVDLEERSLADFAGKAGITSSNAAVRVHRAREALRKQLTLACGLCATHGCLDCHCKSRADADLQPQQ